MLRLIVRLRNLVEKISYEVLELCCFEWFQNKHLVHYSVLRGFRAVLFRMVPKQIRQLCLVLLRFRAVLFRMVPKHSVYLNILVVSFRAVLFRMVPKQTVRQLQECGSFRAVLFRMVPKLLKVQKGRPARKTRGPAIRRKRTGTARPSHNR